MAKRRETIKEHPSYCAGPAWDGDGSKASSRCPFGDSRVVAATRYKCHHCANGLTPSKIYADANGIKPAKIDILKPPTLEEADAEMETAGEVPIPAGIEKIEVFKPKKKLVLKPKAKKGRRKKV